MCTTHVDDLLITGEGELYEASVAKLKTLVDFDKDEIKHFQHCGKTVDQAVDGTIELSQKECAMNIQEIGIAPSRRRQKTEACSALEVSMLRAGMAACHGCSVKPGQTYRFISAGQNQFCCPIQLATSLRATKW